MKTYLHINYFEAGYELEEALRYAKAIGYDGIELRDRDRSGRLPLDEYLELTDAMRRRFELEVTYNCRLDTTHEDAAQREASLDHFLQVIRFAAGLGVSTLNVFTGLLSEGEPLHFSKQGSALAQPRHYEEARHLLKRAAACARQQEMTLCLETHNGYMHDTARATADFLDRVDEPNVQANFDYGNIMLNRHGEPLEDAIDTLGSRIGYVHLKNLKLVPGGEEGQFSVTTLRGGDINNYLLMKNLLASGYKSIVCIENTMKGDRYPAAIEDLAYFRDLLDRIAQAREVNTALAT